MPTPKSDKATARPRDPEDEGRLRPPFWERLNEWFWIILVAVAAAGIMLASIL